MNLPTIWLSPHYEQYLFVSSATTLLHEPYHPSDHLDVKVLQRLDFLPSSVCLLVKSIQQGSQLRQCLLDAALDDCFH